MVDFWTGVADSGQTPLLVQLVKAILVLPHGNAEVERLFSNLSDVVTKKRSGLAPYTVKALLVSRSGLMTNNWTARSIPFTNTLKDLCLNAHASYIQRLRDEEQTAKASQQKKLELDILADVQTAKKTSKKISDLEQNLEKKEKEIKDKKKVQAEQRRLLDDLQKRSKESEEEIHRLMKEQESLTKKKEREADRVAQSVLKRKAVELGVSAMAKMHKRDKP